MQKSTGIWFGDHGARREVLNLDRFMRGSARLTNRQWHQGQKSVLLVDHGGVDHKKQIIPMIGVGATVVVRKSIPKLPSAKTSIPKIPLSKTLAFRTAKVRRRGSKTYTPRTPTSRTSRSRTPCSRTSESPVSVASRHIFKEKDVSSSYTGTISSKSHSYSKLITHDSRLSGDGSYTRQKHHYSRPTNDETCNCGKSRYGWSARSLRIFRSLCQKTLLDQQEQISRVTQICEDLTKCSASPVSTHAIASHKCGTNSRPSSDSNSSKKNKSFEHNDNQCEHATYKIILNKLDEINRSFDARTHSGRTSPHSSQRRHISSSDCASVSDKLVSTDSMLLQTKQLRPKKLSHVVHEISNTCTVDIAPTSILKKRPNFLFENVTAEDCRPDVAVYDPKCGFDLENPIRFYTQAKCLQSLALPVNVRRHHSLENTALYKPTSLRTEAVSDQGAPRRKEQVTSLCGLCRGYWRSIRQYLGSQILNSVIQKDNSVS